MPLPRLATALLSALTLIGLAPPASSFDNDEITESEPGLHVHREIRDDLVLYEVSPFSEPLLSPFLNKVE